MSIMKKGVWHFLVFLVSALVVCCGNPLVRDLTDSLFEKKPGGISSAADLMAIASNLSGNYTLTADINLSSYGSWTPIGDDWTTPFTGTLDGGGHTISWLTIPSATAQGQGLFGYIDNGGTVKNLGLTDVAINSSGSIVGGVAGALHGTSTIRNCYVTGNITGTSSVGGIVGDNIGTIENCYTTASVTGTVTYAWVGGITGNFAGGMIKNCYATGNIYGGTLSTACSGGLVGFYQTPTVMNSVALNLIITGNSSNSGRVAGETSVHTYGNNKARSPMTVAGIPVSGGSPTDKHGADVNVLGDTYSSVFDSTWSPAVWNIPPGTMSGSGSQLPRLKGFIGPQNPTLP